MEEEKILLELFKGVISIGESTYDNFIKSFKKSKSIFSSATELECQIFALATTDYFLHAQSNSKQFVEKFVHDGIKILNYNKKTGGYKNKLFLIQSRYQEYAKVLVNSKSNSWQKNIIEYLSESLSSTESQDEIQAEYPLNLSVGFLEQMEGKLEFVKTQIKLLNLSNDIVIGIFAGKSYAEITKKKGCYIATMVYGDYDSMQVRILRKYRDDILDASLCGKMLISLYYVFSPIFVKIFQRNVRVNNLIRGMLDSFVKRLQNRY